MKKPRRYTWLPDLPDVRDHVYHPPAGLLIPPSTRITDLPPVKDQGPVGSCTGESATAGIESEEIKRGAYVPLSALFYYYQERRVEGTVGSDSGAQIRDGIKMAAKVGCCTEALWPYRPTTYRSRPSKIAYADAATRKITEYMRLSSVADMQACLTEGYPVIFGFTVYESFESLEVARTGVVPMPAPGEKVLGGHAVLLVGYTSSEPMSGRGICMNSWGTGWGQQGFFTMPWAYLANRNLSDDFWSVRL